VNENETLLTVRQLQDLLQVDRITIYRMLGDGRLRGFKVGGQWRFPRQAIEAWLQRQQAALEDTALPCPGPAAEPLTLSPDPLPLSCVQAIQDVFALALGIGAVTTATDGTPITPVANCCRLCRLILDTEAGRERCAGSWRAAAAECQWVPGQSTGQGLPLTTCHAGLSYASARVEVEGRCVAVLHAGQFLPGSSAGETWAARLDELAAATGLRREDLQGAFDSVPILDPERQRQVFGLVERVAGALAEIGTERLALMARLRQIREITQL